MSKSLKPLILICDDEEGIRESFRLILEDDYELVFAESGPSAIEKIKTLSPSLVILDIKMPKMHGLEALKEIKKLSPKTPVVIVSGYDSVELAREAIKLGAADYIPKPFKSDQILKLAQTAAHDGG